MFSCRLLLCAALCSLTLPAFAEDSPPLFDGESFDNWMTLAGEPVAGNWEIADGMIHLGKGQKRSGHIVTRDLYGDFELTFDWKIAPGGNSGIKYRVREYGGKTLGCEYQVYDDAGSRRPIAARKSAGSLYDLYAPDRDKELNSPGEFNSAKIVVRGDLIEHWLNGKQILSATVGSRDWELRIAASKFSEHPDFGANPLGRIMLTDHGSEVWYRNIHLTPLSENRARDQSQEDGTSSKEPI